MVGGATAAGNDQQEGEGQGGSRERRQHEQSSVSVTSGPRGVGQGGRDGRCWRCAGLRRDGQAGLDAEHSFLGIGRGSASENGGGDGWRGISTERAAWSETAR